MTGGTTIGSVEAVEPGSIRVRLTPEAPHATALNTGRVSAFPRINGYLLVPNEVGATVGIVSSIRIDGAPIPRSAKSDGALIDLPFPRRILTLTPIGTLARLSGSGEAGYSVRVSRGVDVFPSVGDPVVLPDGEQLKAILEGDADPDALRVSIGRSPLIGSTKVFVDPNRLFGRHLAVLGNTGSGKSCSVAGLIRWSLDAAATRMAAEPDARPNARFIVLDPNGEYGGAFADLGTRVLQVEPTGDAEPLRVPAWLWNGDEWAAFSGAAPGVQRPILMEALRTLRAGGQSAPSHTSRCSAFCRTYANVIRSHINSSSYASFPGRERVAEALEVLADDATQLSGECGGAEADLETKLQAIALAARTVESDTRTGPKKDGGFWHGNLPEYALNSLVVDLTEVAEVVAAAALPNAQPSEDSPIPFELGDLMPMVGQLARGRDVSQFLDTLQLRLTSLLAPGRLGSVVASDGASSLDEWLEGFLGGSGDSHKITVVDLSLLPASISHIVVAVLSRVIFEALQRVRQETGAELPTVLVLDEAHTFAHRGLSNDSSPAAAKLCCATIERIAREGRKFGLGLVLASQRPSELSPTVLSQCNSYLLHRLVNDRDQDLVRRLVPDSLGQLLGELPSLPARRALLLGWAVPTPVLVEMAELPVEHRPHSPDPGYWEAWTGLGGQPKVDFASLARAWAGVVPRKAEGDEDTAELDSSAGTDEFSDDEIPF